MILYCKVGTLPGLHYKAVARRWKGNRMFGRALRKPPEIGQFFGVRDPGEKYAEPAGVHLLEIRAVYGGQLLYVCEKF